METHIKHIELINQYLNNLLSVEATVAFEKKLETESAFNSLYQEHVILLEGINRVALKQEIAKAKDAYKLDTWLKTFGIIIALATVVVLYFLFSNSVHTENKESLKNSNSTTIPLRQNESEKPTQNSISADSIDSETVNFNNQNADTLKGTESKNTSKNVNNSVEKPSQKFVINVSKDTIISCKEGTLLNIKANSFSYPKTKKVVKGLIELEVTEYYRFSDMLFANLTTTSNGEQLETGGMLYMTASKDDAVLGLNKTMTISFPTQTQKKDMQMFSGEMTEKGINWILEENGKETTQIVEENIEVPFAVVEQAPIYPGCENELDGSERRACFTEAINRHLQRNFNFGVVSGLNLNGSQNISTIFKINRLGIVERIQSNASHPELMEETNRVIALLPRMIPGKQRGKAVTVPYSLPITFRIDADNQQMSARFGSITEIISFNDVVVNDTVYVPLRGIVESVREIMHDKDFQVDSAFANQWRIYQKQNVIRAFGLDTDRKVMLRKQLFEMDNTRFRILEEDSMTRGGHVIRKPWDETLVPTTSQVIQLIPRQPAYIAKKPVSVEEFEKRVNDEKDTLVTTSDLSYYVLRTSKLGWLNCDRFIGGRAKKIKYKIKIKNADDANVNMLFKSYNSVLPSWNTNDEYDFGTVTQGEDVILIAIKRKNGKLYFDTVETKIEETSNLNFNFKEVTLEMLKSEMKKLNRNFN